MSIKSLVTCKFSGNCDSFLAGLRVKYTYDN